MDSTAWKFCKAGEMKHSVESKVFFQWPQTTKCKSYPQLRGVHYVNTVHLDGTKIIFLVEAVCIKKMMGSKTTMSLGS